MRAIHILLIGLVTMVSIDRPAAQDVGNETPESMVGSSGLLPEVETRIEGLTTATLPSVRRAGEEETPQFAGEIHYGWVNAGARATDVILKVTGWNFDTPVPFIVLTQARQTSNLDHGWTDQFAIQVIETGRDFIRLRIRRMDDGTGPSGWGQELRVDMYVIE